MNNVFWRRGWKATAVTLFYAVLIAAGIFFLFPVAWMGGTSLKTIDEVSQAQLSLFPETPQWSNYTKQLGERNFYRAYGNSIYTVLVVLLGTVSSLTVVAFAFSRLQWPGRNVVFALMLGTLMLPAQATLVPQYVLFYELGWLRTFNPITLPGFFAGGASLVFLLRQFMLTLPRELDESAAIDGANPLQMLWLIILPLSRPAIATVTVFLFVGQWNNLVQPLLYLQKAELFTMPIYVAQKNNLQESPIPWQDIMTASVLFVIPVLVIFILTQRYFTEGIALTGSKG
ncbi:MAG: carbohydrate ABC transporter permease [Trueperaceae bacterium]|nr:carbohydrate ABC transporter permease [Trueperaceae bacterium]MCC6309410.1 carbohydrate ABC transporter permease [Trueperaceae bacterium]MCO5173441.1 carbohydrate ABC transporter permease [Trueperaceae bacterium]MCW5819277.1 carbohydrate ABC transporter permease [Trueperaceae bacterium]